MQTHVKERIFQQNKKRNGENAQMHFGSMLNTKYLKIIIDFYDLLNIFSLFFPVDNFIILKIQVLNVFCKNLIDRFASSVAKVFSLYRNYSVR